MTDLSLLPEYESPPLTEVVCGVTFKSLDRLTAAHVGIFWGELQPEYPKVEEYPPIASPIEIFDTKEVSTELEFTSVPPLPREMFLSEDDVFVIQLQRDRFIFNWRRLNEVNLYPRYPQVIEKFENNLRVFRDLTAKGSIETEPIQYELTYINHIPQGDLWEKSGEIGNIFPFSNLSFDGTVLKSPEHVNWRTTFLLPNKLGRLHATIRTNSLRRSDNKPVIFFELTVRGMASDTSDIGRKDWFDLAREWIVRGFTDLTSNEAQEKLWRRTQ